MQQLLDQIQQHWKAFGGTAAVLAAGWKFRDPIQRAWGFLMGWAYTAFLRSWERFGLRAVIEAGNPLVRPYLHDARYSGTGTLWIPASIVNAQPAPVVCDIAPAVLTIERPVASGFELVTEADLEAYTTRRDGYAGLFERPDLPVRVRDKVAIETALTSGPVRIRGSISFACRIPPGSSITKLYAVDLWCDRERG
jgi:hypothetical protein